MNNSYPFIPYIMSTLVPAVKVNYINNVANKTYLIIFVSKINYFKMNYIYVFRNYENVFFIYKLNEEIKKIF